MSWAKATGDAWLFHDVSPATFPTDFWGQADVWIPPETFTACFDGDLFGVTSYFLDFGISAIQASRIQPGPWTWRTSFGNTAASGPAPSTTYTIKFHYYSVGPGFSQGQVDWYVNGTLIATDTGANKFTEHLFFLNHFPEGCCCEIYYYTKVRLGTTDGGTEIFADDFSGGLGAWQQNQVFMPSAVGVVASPVAAACPTVTVTPPRGLPGDTITVTGTGFAPNAPLMFFVGSRLQDQDEGFSGVSDASGNVHVVTTIPHHAASGSFDPWDVYLLDEFGNVACTTLAVCGSTPADGITTAPDPVVATGGVTNADNEILDYIFHDGAHWVLWQDPSTVENLGTFPPPTNHTMNATRISADGSSVADYPIDTNYQWIFGGGGRNDEGLGASRPCPGGGGTVGAPVWSQISFFERWAKPIDDAHFASDGTNLWVAILTKETILYPWLDNQDACDLNPGSAAQFVPLATLTSGFTSFPTDTSTGYHRWNTQTTGAIDFYKPNAFPVTDAGEQDMGYWSPPVVVMFSFDGSAFNRIGEIDAKYCPGLTNGMHYGTEGSIIGGPRLTQKTQRGSLFSRVSICASPNDPGICHVVWSEGGDWGRQGLAASDCSRLVWDSGPQNKSYRVNYTTWSPSAKLTDSDIFSSHFDRTNGEFSYTGFEVGYTWPDQAHFAGLLNHDLRNDNAAGTPYLFAVWPQSFQNPFESDPFASGDPYLDNYLVWGDTLHIYDLSSGGAVEVQALDLSTLGMTEAEILSIWTVGLPFAPPYGPVDAVMLPPLEFENNGAPISSYGPQDKGFGISLPYDDPALGVPVYLVHIPLIKRFLNQATSPRPTQGVFAARGFYRVPCDMSTGFDYLDGIRQPDFTILKEPYAIGPFGGSDFFSDPKNIWVPDSSGVGFGFGGFPGLWFDRVCNNAWETFSGAWTPFVNNYWLGSQCPGFYYDSAADSITTVAGAVGPGNPPPSTPLFAITTQFICRGCRGCKCATGIHLAHRF